MGLKETAMEDLWIRIRIHACWQHCDVRLGDGNDVGATDATRSDRVSFKVNNFCFYRVFHTWYRTFSRQRPLVLWLLRVLNALTNDFSVEAAY